MFLKPRWHVPVQNLVKYPPPGVWGRKRSPKFVRYFEILIVAAAQSNALLFALGGKFRLKNKQPIRSHYSKYSILIGRVTDLCPEGDFCPV